MAGKLGSMSVALGLATVCMAVPLGLPVSSFGPACLGSVSIKACLSCACPVFLSLRIACPACSHWFACLVSICLTRPVSQKSACLKSVCPPWPAWPCLYVPMGLPVLSLNVRLDRSVLYSIWLSTLACLSFVNVMATWTCLSWVCLSSLACLSCRVERFSFLAIFETGTWLLNGYIFKSSISKTHRDLKNNNFLGKFTETFLIN